MFYFVYNVLFRLQYFISFLLYTKMVQFIQVCEKKIYGDKVWINVDAIASFSRDKTYSVNEGMWYKIILNNGSICFTLYNLQIHNVYTLPDF